MFHDLLLPIETRKELVTAPQSFPILFIRDLIGQPAGRSVLEVHPASSIQRGRSPRQIPPTLPCV